MFGWRPESYGPPDGVGGYTEFKLGDRSVAGMLKKTPEMPAEMPNNWGVYFTVDDTDAAVAKVQELGGTVIMPPTDIEPGRFAVVMDPTGAPFNIIKMKEGAG